MVYGEEYEHAGYAVARLVEEGLLEQVSEGNYNRIFASLPLLDLFER